MRVRRRKAANNTAITKTAPLIQYQIVHNNGCFTSFDLFLLIIIISFCFFIILTHNNKERNGFIFYFRKNCKIQDKLDYYNQSECLSR